MTVEAGGSITVEEGASIVLLGELVNRGQLFFAPDSTMSVAGSLDNQGFIENGGGFYNKTTIENEGRWASECSGISAGGDAGRAQRVL